MDSKDHTNTQHSPGGKSHVCTKCGWNYPNPHPSAKNRRSHKKICGTIKGFEILGSEQANQNLDLQKDHCLDDDEPKTPSPSVVEKADERIGDISEEDVFADAVCEFSSSVVKEKEETAANDMAPGETQQCNKSSIVVQESCEVPPVKVLENFLSSVESPSKNRQGGESSTEGDSMTSKSLIETSQEAHVINGGDSISNVGLETEGKENTPDESESKLASALGKRKDTLDSSWNDEVIYSDVEGPHGFAFEDMSMPGEADYAVSESVLVDTSYVKDNAAQVISTTPSVLPDAQNVDVSLHGTKGLEEFESNRSVNTCFPESPKGEECDTDTLTQADNLDDQLVGLSIGTEVPSSNKLPLEDKTEHQDQISLVALKEFPSEENTVLSKIELEDIKMKAGSSFGASQETVESETMRSSLPAVDPIVANSNADVSHSDLIGPESELVQTNVVAEENNTVSELRSESSCAEENYVSPVSVALDESDQNTKRSTETSKDSIDQISTESEDCTTPNDCAKTVNHKLLESGRTEFNRVVGGLGVIQANEMDGNVKAHDIYAEVPVTVESNDHRDFGRLQNLSEAHIRSLVLSPLVTRDNTSNAISGHTELENESQSSPLAVALSKNPEIKMEKTTSWSTAKEQHVPLKNLLNEARSPRVVAAEANNIQRVSSILEQETSPEEGGGGWPERREVSEEWNSPAKYPVERKVKGRPFWVPFVCCSSAAK